MTQLAWLSTVGDEVERRHSADSLKSLVAQKVRQQVGLLVEDSCGHRLANSCLFHALGLFLTLLNCVALAIEVDSNASSALSIATGGQRVEGREGVFEACLAIRRAFIGWLACEVILHLLGDRADFFLGPQCWWNLYDVVLLVLSLSEFITTGPRMSFLRFLRVARSSRALQALHFVRCSPSLQKMMASIGAVASWLFWAACLLFVFVYVVGVLMMEGVILFLQDGPTGQRHYDSMTLFAGAGGVDLLQDLQSYYGTLGRTLTTLFRAISGADWSAFAAPLSAMGWVWSVVWLGYVLLAALGLLNVVTGVVVDIVKKPVPNERLLHLQAEAAEAGLLSRMFTDELARLGRCGPDDRLSRTRFRAFVSRPAVVRRLREFGLDVGRLTEVFSLIDVGHEGGLTAEQAAWGLLRLRGEARACDLANLERGLRHLALELKGVGAELSLFRNQAAHREEDEFHM